MRSLRMSASSERLIVIQAEMTRGIEMMAKKGSVSRTDKEVDMKTVGTVEQVLCLI